MVFFSLSFVLFVACLLLCYYACGRLFPKYQWIVLLVGSMAFYCIAGGWQMLSFMLVTALTTWGGALLLSRLSAQGKAERKAAKGRDAKRAVKQKFLHRRRLVLVGALVITLGMLGYLKYWNTILFNFGLEPSPRSLGILLPFGISFYMFTSLGYFIEVYNDKYAPEPNFAHFLLFVSWFPQLTQGPINRFDEISQQLFASRHADPYLMRRGLLRLAYGIFKKYAIANVLIINFNAIFTNVNVTTVGPVIIIGILIYSIEMYADFSGGIDIVEGVSELFGVEMAQNFRQPYFSVSLSDFWRRWHMSLGAFMRDHVFYPLAVTKPMKALNKHATKVLGKQVGRTISACVANIIVFLLVGLWHGAEWHFILWGLYNGVIIALSDLLAPVFDRLARALHVNRDAAWFHVFAILRTFAVVAVGRYFDCMEDVGLIFLSLKNTVFNFTAFELKRQLELYGVMSPETYGFVWPVIVACLVVFVISVLYERGTDVRAAILKMGCLRRMALYLTVGLVFVFSMGYGLTQGEVFLYAFF